MKAQGDILVLDKTDFKTKNAITGQRVFSNDKTVNLQERYNSINTWFPNNRASEGTKQKLTALKGEIIQFNHKVRDFNTPL